MRGYNHLNRSTACGYALEPVNLFRLGFLDVRTQLEHYVLLSNSIGSKFGELFLSYLTHFDSLTRAYVL